VTFPADRDTLEAEPRAARERLGAALQASTIGRILLNSEASVGEDLSTHRRLTLARARAVKAALVAGGLTETRVDIRALGRTPNGRDAVDILSPTAPR
jgi:outer membrane protein OmpA-like peptidoglycan-associated protein